METGTKKTQDGWENRYKDSKRVIPADEWETQRNNFTRLYITEDFRLERVRQIMAERYGFFANTKQCKAIIKKWGLEKNLSRSKVNAMLQIQQKRALKSKKTEFRLNGQPIKKERLERAEKRHRREGKIVCPGSPSNVITEALEMGIEYSTPKPTPSLSDTVNEEIAVPSTQIIVHDILGLLDRTSVAISSSPSPSSSGYSEYPSQETEADNGAPLANFMTPFHTHDSDKLSIPSRNIYPPLLSTPEESHSKANDISPSRPQPQPSAALSPPVLSWEPIPRYLNDALGLAGKEFYHVDNPPPIDYSTIVRGTMQHIDDSILKLCLKDRIDRVKECLAEQSEILAGLMEEDRFLSGLGGYSKVTLTLNLVKDKDMLESDLSHRYKAETLVALGWQRGREVGS